MKNRTALCVQTGNAARVYADLLKLQALNTAGKIDSAVCLLFTKSAGKKVGSNLASFERLVLELRTVLRGVVTVPLLVIGLALPHEE
jgi:hypothetical protein